jgi:hypothetical protein
LALYGNVLHQHIPDKSRLQKHHLSICYEETLENIRGNIEDAIIWVAVDENGFHG